MPARRDKPASVDSADLNRIRRIEASRCLERALKRASDAGFTGHVAVEIHSKDGRLGVPKTTEVRFGLADP